MMIDNGNFNLDDFITADDTESPLSESIIVI